MLTTLLLLVASPPVTLERVVDGRDREVAVVARAERAEEAGRVEVRVVRGLIRRDIVLRSRLPKQGGVEVHEVWLDDGPALRLERPRDRSRVTIATPASSFRYHEEDAKTRTVLCAISRLDGLDPALPDAAEEIDKLERALAAAETPAPGPLKVLRFLRPPAVDSPPVRRRVPLPADGEGAATLAAIARAALDRTP